jgi:hypothetical protein
LVRQGPVAARQALHDLIAQRQGLARHAERVQAMVVERHPLSSALPHVGFAFHTHTLPLAELEHEHELEHGLEHALAHELPVCPSCD